MTKIYILLLLALALLLVLVRGARVTDGLEELASSEEAEWSKNEENRTAHQQGCSYIEKWEDWSECSATCGGGIQTSKVTSTTSTTEWDPNCPDKVERKFRPCAQDVMCPADCITVDLNNRLDAPGGAARWDFEMEEGAEAEGCIFQFWQVLADGWPPRIRLLAQTKYGADLRTPRGAAVYDMTSFILQNFTLQLENADVAYDKVAIGFRGCRVRRTSEEAPVAKVCIFGESLAFKLEDQVAALDKEQKYQLSRYQHEQRYKRTVCSGDTSVGEGDTGVTFEGKREGKSPGFEVKVVMSPQPPWEPIFRGVSEVGEDLSEVGDDLLVKLSLRDGGAKINPDFAVSLRRQFFRLQILAQDNDHCNLLPLKLCGNRPKEPCFSNAPATAGPGIVLRNLVFASRYEVQLQVQNSAGWSRPNVTYVVTRTQPGIPLKDCAVDFWSCAGGGVEDDFPYYGAPECSLTALPLPTCYSNDWLGSVAKEHADCAGQRYAFKCKAVLQEGADKCAGGALELTNVCTYRPPETRIRAGHAPICKKPGCPSSIWKKKQHCCCRSDATPDLPSQVAQGRGWQEPPKCACTTETCNELGMVEDATAKSCLH